MMPYDKYETGRQHLNGGLQRITYNKNNNNKEKTYPSADPKLSMGRGRPCRSNSFAEFSCVICLKYMSNVSIYYESLTKNIYIYIHIYKGKGLLIANINSVVQLVMLSENYSK